MHDFNLLPTLLTIIGVLAVLLGSTAFLIYVERKIAAYIQDRIGPNRVGPFGLLQSLADGLKFLFKEEIIPRHVDKFLYILAPVLGVVLLTGSLNLERIIQQQAQSLWLVLYQPLAFLLFMISSFAECNRLPFDLPEAEQELVGGYHTEYSAMKFAMFFLGEYTHMITTSFLMVILFFGGWHFPWVAEADAGWLLKLVVFAVKMAMFIIFYMLVRWTIPRFRFD